MKFKKSLLIICLVICLFFMASVSASDATITATDDNLEIDQPTDEVIGVEEDIELDSSATNEVLKADEQIFAHLNTTINGNNDSDIYLESDYKYSDGDDSFKSGIVIDRDVNIYGNGHIINGSNGARIFNVTGGNVVFYNITFVNGDASNSWLDSGGAINGDCKAINCTFKENHASFDGGAIYGGSAVDCTFTNNSAENGGAMDGGSAVNCSFTGNHANNFGGAMFDGSAVDCIFTSNSATSGGVMYGGSAVNCSFTGNSAENGGAMVYGSAIDCTFTGNHANKGGGAMVYGSAIDCTFTGNSASIGGAMGDGSAMNCTFTNNSAYNEGGAMWDGSAMNCSFSGNHADDDGGAVYWGSVVNCSFSGNHADDDGGAMSGGSAVNCSFSGNHADDDGGAMYWGYKVNCLGQDSDFYCTEDLVLHFDANDFTTVCGSGETLPIKLRNQNNYLIPFINYDVVIYRDGEKVRTYHCLSNDDLSLDLAVGTYTAELAVTYPGLDKPEPTNIKVTIIGKSFSELNKTINNNSNDVIYLDADYTYNSTADSAFSEGIVINRDVIIYGNGHTINGSGEARIFQINGGNIVFYNITFVNGNASNNEEDSGGAINGNCKAINCTFKENHANNFGGAMFDGSAVNCSFSGNHADYSGGAMFFGSAVNCSFSGNSAYCGGAMFGVSAVNCSFSGNHAEEGGAMYGGSAVNCSFSGNSATSSGGAMDSVSAVNCSFSGNHADKGGAMFFGSAVNCSFSGNSADHDGGAMAYGSAVNCSFSGNSANCGGAMYGGYKVDCIGQDSDFIDTGELVLHWEVDNFTTVYGSGEMLPIELRNQQRAFVDFINYDVVIYKEGVRIKTYHCLSNDYLSFDLPAGVYTAVLIVTYPNLDSIPYNISLTVNKSPSNVEVSAADVTYPDSVRVNVKSNVTAEYVVSVGGMNQTVNLVAGVAQEVIFTGLAANEDGYIVNVESENYTGLNYTVKVVVHKAAPTINVSAVDVSYPGDVVVSVKSDVNGTYIVKVGDKSQNVTLEANVTKNVTFTGLAANEAGYTINVTHDSENYTGFNDSAVVKIMKVAVKLTANAVTATYNVNKNLVITLKDSTGKALSGVKVTVNLNGAKTYTTDRNGQIKINVAKLVPKTYTAKVTFAGDSNYKASSADVKVTVKKAKAKIKAKKKTYKAKKKVKKFKITLKDNKGKPIKKAKVRLIVKKIKKTSKKKTSKSKENKKKNILKTNKKGKITFKINRNKKGKYMATVKFYGNKYYTKAVKKVKIKMK